jgi:trigger factor
MQVTVSRLSPVEVSLRIVLAKEKVDAELDRAFQKLGRDAQIRGFRKGKVPRPVLKQYFGGQVASDVFRKMIDETLPGAIRDQKLEVIGQPRVEAESDLLSTAEWAYTAQVEVRPDMSGIDLGALKLTRKVYAVGDKELDVALQQKREENATLRTPDPMRPVQETDTATFDVAILVDGAELAEFGAKGRTVEIGRNTLIKEIDDGLRGMSPGDVKEVPVTFPETHRQKELAGKAGSFRLTLTTIQEKVLPELDDEFAKDLGEFDSLAALKDRIRADMQQEAEDNAKRDVRSDLMRQLAQRISFELPTSLVEREIDRRLEEMARQLMAQKIDPRQAGIDWGQFREAQREPAREAVSSALVLDEIARREQITVAAEDVDKEIEQFATRAGRTPAALRAQLEKEGGIARLSAGLRREKAVDLAKSRAKIASE